MEPHGAYRPPMPKIIAPLTANGIEKAHRASLVKQMGDGMVPGLVFRVGRTGSSWSLLTYDHQGNRKRITFGSYPDVSLAQARIMAVSKRDALKEATDESRSTFREMIDAYERQEAGRLRTWADQRSGILFVFKPLTDMPCGEVTARAIQRLVDSHPARVMALRALAYLAPILKWGRRRGWTEIVVSDLERPKRVVAPRERVLSPDEQMRVVRALYGATEPHYRVMWLLMLTACRRDEIAELRWDEVELSDDPVLRIPKERYKTGIDFVVPLVPQAQSVLWEIMGEGIDGATVFGAMNNWSRWGARLHKASNTSGWTRHDLRRTTATIAGELGYAPHVVDAALGHKHIGGSAIHGTYNKSRYLPETRDALTAIANYYISLTE